MGAAFPDVVGDSYMRTATYKTALTKFGDQNQRAFRKWVRPRHAFELKWSLLQPSDRSAIEDFIKSMYGPFTAFDWFDWRSSQWLYVPMGLTDGNTAVFTLPGKATSGQQFFLDGTTVVSFQSISAGTGPNGEDEVTFGVAPPDNHYLSCRFAGRRRFTVRNLQMTPFTDLLEPPTYSAWSAMLTEKK